LRSDDVALQVRERVPLGALTTLGVGGPARWCCRVERPQDLETAHRWCEERSLPLLVLGGGSNLVIADEGFDGLVLQIGLSGLTFSHDSGDTLVTAGAGEPWDIVVATLVDRGLAGVECLSGIPGTVGGTPIQNVGAYGQDVSSTIDRVTVFDRIQRDVQSLTAHACAFSYRMSRFKKQDAGRFIVCDVTFRVRPGSPTSTYADVVTYLKDAGVTRPSVAEVRSAVLAIRRRKGMVLDEADPDSRSVGSFFMNPTVGEADRERISSIAGQAAPGFAMGDRQVKIPAAWLIERAGFHKGHADGAVGISTKHPLALINRGGATARDVLRLATAVKRSVADRFSVWLEPEPVFVGFGADRDVEFLTKARG